MATQETATPNMELRIQALESRSRKLVILCTTLLALGVAVMFQNFRAQGQLLSIDRKMRVNDHHDQARAIIHAEPENSGLTFYDALNQDRAMIGASHTGSGLTLRDKQANQRIVLRVNEDGPELLMMDASSTVRFRAVVDETGGRVTTYNESGGKIFDSSEAGWEGGAIEPLWNEEDTGGPWARP